MADPAFEAARGSRENASMLAVARLAAFWWEQQEHPIDHERPGKWFARHVARVLLGNATEFYILSDDESEQTFASLIRIAQDARG